jgi:NADH-ubiquinone oxidoreductase chain 3
VTSLSKSVVNLVILIGFLAFVLVFLLTLVSIFISESVVLNREELSSYECGFEHHSGARLPFSLRFFLLTLVFLLFDLEVVLIIFCPLYVYSSCLFSVLFVLSLFVLVLLIGLLYE